MRLLLIDNYDSYTYNLAQLIARAYGRLPTVLPNNAPGLADTDFDAYDAVVVSPGPGRPQTPADIGQGAVAIRRSGLPVLGVCLGHQMLGWLAGAEVSAAPVPRHGYIDRIRHLGTHLFAGIPQNFPAVRYHSLSVLPGGEIEPIAWSQDGVVMGLRHVREPWWGVQFHPESIATMHGTRIMENFRGLVASRGRNRLVVTQPVWSPVPAPAAAPVPTPRRGSAGRGWRRYVRVVERVPDAARLFRRCFAGGRFPWWLDSSRVADGLSRFSFMGASRGPYGETLVYRVNSRTVRMISADGSTRSIPGSIYDVLRRRLGERRATGHEDLPFDLDGGYVGFLGYEMKAESTGDAGHRSSLPDAVWTSATHYVAIDHLVGRTYIVGNRGPGEDATDVERWADQVEEAIDDGPESDRPGLPTGPAITDLESLLRRPREGYLRDVATCIDLLRRGESYEICLTNALTAPFAGDPLAFYDRQRDLNAAPYAAFLSGPGFQIASSSPERFLRVTRDRAVESKPIKGTAARHLDPELDAVRRTLLSTSDKTRAENMMIVDLLRNDLGSVCEVGSVHVPEFMAVESYATVHQLVSTVRGRLRPDVDALAATQASFPGGSMTGAPKKRTMQIIDDLEGAARGIYSGAVGYFGTNGAADLSIVIRTAVLAEGRLSVGAGGAIVLDSDPVDEFEEMLLKARATMRPLLADEADLASTT